LELQRKIGQIVDEAARRSRAGFDRGVREIWREIAHAWAATGARHAPASADKPP
jgi:hypothetical protein